MSRLERVRQWARENRDPSILEVMRHTHWWSILVIALGPCLGALAFVAVADVPDDQLHTQGKIMLAIFVLAAAYWVTGAIPPFATAMLVIGLEVYLIGLPTSAGGFFVDHADLSLTGWQQFVAPAAAPIIVLMLGGFILSKAAHKHGLDRVMAVTFLKPFGTRSGVLLLGVMLITANFSMWMSNTATAALMLTLIAPIISKFAPGSSMRKAFILAIPLSANIGGMGTPIGTPPNAIAFGALHTMGVEISFIGWMIFGLPLAVVLLLVAWVYLLRRFGVAGRRIEVQWEQHSGVDAEGPAHDPRQWIVYCTFAVTVGLWMTSSWTHVPVAAVAIVPIVVFTATRLLDRHDINQVDWDILLLMAGGLALGGGMASTGLASWMIESVPMDNLGPSAVIIVFCAATLTLSTFMSNTAVANLLMPIALGVATLGGAAAVGAGVVSPLAAGVCVALGASLAMGLPVSTPPNAIAFASGELEVKDLVRSGVLIGVCGLGLVTLLCVVFLVG